MIDTFDYIMQKEQIDDMEFIHYILEVMTINSNPVICRCEEVLLSEIMNELENGTKTTKELKLRTRAGMGICQGKTCRPMLEKLVSVHTSDLTPPASRLSHNFPARPITFKELSRNNK
ncbi:(2Fe-2S)-binding protein [Virgibacillus sp. W0181]|uniref:(2Fe-2S)-binding protein n=1 Tax=Virgibacillus sp. W0181 TaxID=3391581 RepID=UPI003F4722A2